MYWSTCGKTRDTAAQTAENKTKNPEMENASQKYLQNVSEQIDVPKESLFYVSTSSEEGFLHKLHPAMISFVRGNKTTSIEDIKVMGSDGLTSSCEVNAVTKELIEQHLAETERNYHAVDLKSIQNQEAYNFQPDQLVAVMLYGEQMGSFAEPYVEALKRLENEEGIPYIIISMDGELLTDLEDVYGNKSETTSTK